LWRAPRTAMAVGKSTAAGSGPDRSAVGMSLN
jgi:hypothetical protein